MPHNPYPRPDGLPEGDDATPAPTDTTETTATEAVQQSADDGSAFAEQVDDYEVHSDTASMLEDFASQMGGGGMDMSGLLAQAQAMQAQFEAAQKDMSERRITGSAGGDLVEVTMSGAGEVLEVAIKPEACDPEDTETLGDLVVAAIRDAAARAQAVQQATMGPITGFGM